MPTRPSFGSSVGHRFFVSLVLSTLPLTALAGGTSFDGTSVSAMGNAYAGQAAEASDASVLFANPAALTRFERAEMHMGVSGVMVNSTYVSEQDNDGVSTNAGTRGSRGQVFDRRAGFDAGRVAPSVYIAYPLNNRLVAGFGVSGAHGLVLSYDPEFPGRNQGRDIDLKVIRMNLGLGYKLSSTLSVGIAGSIEHYYQKTLIRLNYLDAIDKLTPGPGTELVEAIEAEGIQVPLIPEETNAKLRVEGWALNLQLGALWEPSGNTRVGVSYRPHSHFEDNTGTFSIDDSQRAQTFREALRNPLVALAGIPLGLDSRVIADDLEPQQSVRQSVIMPDEFRFSLFHHATPRIDLMATYTRQDFSQTSSRFERDNGRLLQNVPQNYSVAHSLRLGMNYRWNPYLLLKAGLALETQVIDDDTRITVLPDADRLYWNVGATFDHTPDLSLHLAYQNIQLDAAPVGNNRSITPVEVSGGEFNGTVKTNIHFLGLGLTQKF